MWPRGRHRSRRHADLPDVSQLGPRADELLESAHEERAKTEAAGERITTLADRATELARGNHFQEAVYRGLLRPSPPAR
jgi:hypothetical protein